MSTTVRESNARKDREALADELQLTLNQLSTREALADELQLTLDQLGINQMEAGKRCNVSRTTVNKILKLRLVPTSDTMGALDVGLGTGRRLRDLANIARAAHKPSRGAPPPPQQVPLGPELLHRDDELRHLRNALTTRPIVILTGPPGVGTTAVIRTLAHQEADFPNGILSANLTSTPADPAGILYRWLIALGTDDERIPSTVENRRSMLQARLTGCRALITLEDATAEDQIRPLLPHAPGCPVLVTSNRRLPGLRIRDGAKHHTLNSLDHQASVDVLGHMLGATAPRDTQVLREIADHCDGLPLALAAAAELITTHGLHGAATRLAHSPLAALDDAAGNAGTGLAGAYEAAWHRLSPAAQHHLIICAQGNLSPQHCQAETGCDAAGALRQENLLTGADRLGVLLRDWLRHHNPHANAPGVMSCAA